MPGAAGTVTVTLVLPQPQLPQSVHDITVDDTFSHRSTPSTAGRIRASAAARCSSRSSPLSVLYGQAQNLAFYQATHNPQLTRPLVSAAETEATQIIRDNFIQPTVNALGYSLSGFTLRWSGAP